MHVLGTRLALVAGLLATAGLAGCSLPHVLPTVSATTPGPSPYGVWYEQHWATNSVLLAAADQPETTSEIEISDDAVIEDRQRFEEQEDADRFSGPADEAAATPDAPGDDAAARAEASANAAVEAANALEAHQQASDFDNSTPYQFPASSFVPPSADGAPADEQLGGDGAIRY